MDMIRFKWWRPVRLNDEDWPCQAYECDVLGLGGAVTKEWLVVFRDGVEDREEYQPLQACPRIAHLFFSVARLEPIPAIPNFAAQFGPLHRPSPVTILVNGKPRSVCAERLATWKDSVGQMGRLAEILTAINSQDKKDLRSEFKMHDGIRFDALAALAKSHVVGAVEAKLNNKVHPKFVSVDDGLGFAATWEPTDLESAIYLQFMQYLAGSLNPGICEYCFKSFPRPDGVIDKRQKRRDAKFCSDAHKQAAYRNRQK